MAGFWVQRSPATPPSPRYNHAIAYDAVRDRVILFGGQDRDSHDELDDTWEWDGTDWTELSPDTAPPARSVHAMAWHGPSAKIVLFGGLTGPTWLDDTWTWDGTDWTEESPGTVPTRRADAQMSTDDANTNVVLFGGLSDTVPAPSLLDDTLTWDGSDWTPLSPATTPTARSQAGMSFDSALNKVVMFGGRKDNGGGGSVFEDETWTWDGTDWTQETPVDAPSARIAPELTADAFGLVLYGGFETGVVQVTDTWVWEAMNWSVQSPSPTPVRGTSGKAFAFHSSRNESVLLTAISTGILTSETWIWTYAARGLYLYPQILS